MDYKKLSKIVDMARVNKNESSLFPFNSFKLTMWSNDHEPIHFRIESNQEGYKLKSDLEGNIKEVIKSGRRKSKDINDFKDVAALAKEWLPRKSADPLANGKTNKEWLEYVWHIIHD